MFATVLGGMRRNRNTGKLPNPVRALWFACRCFNIQAKDLGFSQMTISRACAGVNIKRESLDDVQRRMRTAIYERFRTALAPISHVNTVTDTLFSVLLGVYERVLPKVKIRGLSELQVMWVLAEHVFVPTVFAVVLENRTQGIGSEFQGPECWYVATEQESAFQRVFCYWLRTAGLHTGYGLSRHLQLKQAPREQGGKGDPKTIPESLKHKLESWASGRSMPESLKEVYDLVDQLAERVAWLDSDNSWKARLRLAYAVGECGRLLDNYFKDGRTGSFSALAEHFRELCQPGDLCDVDKMLVRPGIYFASRLYQQRLRRIGEFQRILDAVPKNLSAQFGPEAPEHVIEAQRQSMERQMNAGNWLLGRICDEAKRVGYGGGLAGFEDYLFDQGVDEINRVLKSCKGTGGRTRRP